MEVIVQDAPLSPVEQDRLKALEAVIQENFLAFVAVGNALMEIRENKLYRTDEGRTWEGYCREIWDMGYKYADKLVSASKVIENLTPIGVKADGSVDWELLPANESQARELAGLDPEKQKQVWEQLISSSRSAFGSNVPVKITAKAVKNAVKASKGEQLSETIKKAGEKVKNSVKPDKNRQSTEFTQAWENLMEQIEEERRFDWKNTPRDVVFNTLVQLARTVGECGKQTMREKKITFRSNNVDKLLAAGFGIFRRSADNKMIEQMESAGSWVVYGEYENEETGLEVFSDLMIEPMNIQA
jgi:hypothetical protein